MNNLYFSSPETKVFIDIGDRWAYWALEHTGIVERGRPVDVDAVLGAEKYWKSEDPRLALEVLPPVTQFLEEHREKEITFGDERKIIPPFDEHYFEWKQVGYRAELSPRTFAEEMGYTEWEDVEKFLESLGNIEKGMETAQKKREWLNRFFYRWRRKKLDHSDIFDLGKSLPFLPGWWEAPDWGDFNAREAAREKFQSLISEKKK